MPSKSTIGLAACVIVLVFGIALTFIGFTFLLFSFLESIGAPPSDYNTLIQDAIIGIIIGIIGFSIVIIGLITSIFLRRNQYH